MDIKNVQIGMKVAVNDMPEAVVWTVVDKNGFAVALQENNFAPQWIDCGVLIPVKK